MVRIVLSAIWLLTACGPTATNGEGAQEPTDSPDVPEDTLTDDPARARSFQAPFDIFVAPIDLGLSETALGTDPAEAFGDIVLTEPAGYSAQPAAPERIEVGELELLLTVIKDRGPPESERWEQTTLELTAVRAGGNFRLTGLHSELRRLAEEPPEGPDVPSAWVELRDAILDGISGPACRFLPRLRRADMQGLYSEADIAAAEEQMPDQGRVDRTCADWWDRMPEIRSLVVRRLTFYRVDPDRNVLGRYEATITADDGVIQLGPVSFE